MTFEILALGMTTPDFISRRIQKGTRANYSHVAILVDGKTVYHAISGGVCRQSLESTLKWGPHEIRRRVRVEVKSGCCALTWLNARIGTPYSVVQFLGFIFPFLRFLPFVDNGRKEVVCSEFGAEFMSECCSLDEIAQKAYGDCDWIDPKKCLDIAAGLYGEIDT